MTFYASILLDHYYDLPPEQRHATLDIYKANRHSGGEMQAYRDVFQHIKNLECQLKELIF